MNGRNSERFATAYFLEERLRSRERDLDLLESLERRLRSRWRRLWRSLDLKLKNRHQLEEKFNTQNITFILLVSNWLGFKINLRASTSGSGS